MTGEFHIRSLICLCTFLALQITVQAQVYPYKQYTTKDGLCNSSVYRIAQDMQGYIWLSTDYGISKFDGYSFDNHFLDEYNGTILGLATNAKNEIWVGGLHNNLYCIHSYDSSQGIKLPDKKKNNNIVRTYVDNLQRTWIFYEDGVGGYIEQYKFIPLKLPEKAGINNILGTSTGEILLLTSNGVYKYLTGDTAIPFFKGLYGNPVYSGYETDEGKIYFGGKGYIYECVGDNIKEIPAGEDPIINIEYFKDGAYWIVYKGRPGIYRYKNMEVQDMSSRMGLNMVFVNDIYVDKRGTLFIATHGQGLFVLNNFNLLAYNSIDPLPSDNIYSITQDDNGNIYAGGFGGILIYKNDKLEKYEAMKFARDEMVNDMLWVNGDLWVATPFYIYRYTPRKKKLWKKYYGAVSLCLDGDGNVLVGGYMHLLRFDPKSTLTETPIVDTLSKEGERISNLMKDTEGNIWATANNRVYCISGNDKKVFDSGNTPLKGYVNDMVQDDSGDIWLAASTGLLRYNGSIWQIYTEENGLSDKNCTSISFINDKMLVGTRRGINILEGNMFNIYSSGNVVINEDVNTIFKDKHQNLWVGTNDGLFQWMYNSDTLEKTPPATVIKGMRTGTANTLLPVSDTLTLPYSDNYISIEFVAIDYEKPQDIIYEYRLSNTEDIWHHTSNRSIAYSSLSPGAYTLEIRTGYTNSELRSPVVKLNFIVLKPFWQKWWFILSVGAFISIIITLTVKWYVINEKQKTLRKTQRDIKELKLKQQAVNALINPHFIFNSLNSIQSLINHADLSLANRYLSKFARLIRATMENATQLEVPLKQELQLLDYYLSLEVIRLDGKMTYSIEVSPEIDAMSTMVPSMLIQPYVENAVWHGITPKKGNGHITISITRSKKQYLFVKIEDDGVGMKHSKATAKKQQHKSRGVNITRERLEIIEKLTGKPVQCDVIPLYNESGISIGTRVEMIIPVDQSNNININTES